MANRKLEKRDVDELFVLQNKWKVDTKTVGIEIHDMLEKIEDEDNKKKPIFSPTFQLGGIPFNLIVTPEKIPGFISFVMSNESNEDQITSFQIKGVGLSFNTNTMTMKRCLGRGWDKFRSHEEYKKWVKKNQDVFKVEVTVSLHTKVNHGDDWKRSRPNLKIPKDLTSQETLPSLNKAIMKDESTADLTVICQSKTFRVHKNFLCAKSPVLRAMIQSDMEEGRKGEIKIPDIDENTLAAMFHYIYTGELELGEDVTVQNVAYAADKYNLSGWIALLCFKIGNDDISEGEVADLLLTANKHNSVELRQVALEKIRANRKILDTELFRKKMRKANSDIIIDLFNDL